jgi:pimeloyl-ACP methyl ester carboxylesterase
MPERVKAGESQIAKASAGVQAESAAVETSYEQARVAKVPTGIPLILLSATEDESMPAEARKVWIEQHKEWSATVPGSKHIIVEKTTHFIQAQQPALVIDAIRQVMKKAH